MPRDAAVRSAPLKPSAPSLSAQEKLAADDVPRVEPKEAVQADAQPASTGAPVHITPDTDWPALVQRLELPAGLPRALAQQSELRAIDGDAWLLRAPNEQLTRAGALDKLQAAVRAALGRDVTLRVETGDVTDSATQRDLRAKAQAQADAETAIRSDPLVQQLMQDLGAQIVPGSLKPLPPTAQASSA